MENRLGVSININNGIPATVTFIETRKDVRYDFDVHKYEVQTGTNKLRRKRRWIDLDEQFFVIRYRGFNPISPVCNLAY